MWVTTARFAHCQRCTNCSRQFCTEDYTQCLTRNKQNIRLASENLTRQLTTLQHTDWLNKNAMSGEWTCGQRQLTSWRRSIPSLTSQFGTPSSPATSSMITWASWRRYTETKRHLYRRTKRATFSISVKEQSKVIRCPACCSTRFFNTHRWQKDEIQRDGNRKKGMGVYHERQRSRLPHEPEICRRRDAVRNIQRTDTENVVWIQESYWKSGAQDPSRQDEDSQ